MSSIMDLVELDLQKCLRCDKPYSGIGRPLCPECFRWALRHWKEKEGDSDVSKIYVEVPDPKYIERL